MNIARGVKARARVSAPLVVSVGLLFLLVIPEVKAQNSRFHGAPASAARLKNPYAGNHASAEAGARIFASNCARCHGERAQGVGNIPSLSQGPTQAASDGELFWFITRGDPSNGMPSWAKLPLRQRWELVTYLKMLKTTAPVQPPPERAAGLGMAALSAPLPKPPFVDFRLEIPGKVHKITLRDLPRAYASRSAQNPPRLVPRPESMWPQAPVGFKVQLFASGLDNPRMIVTAPNGDIFVAESDPGDIKVFRGITAESRPQQVSTFVSSLNRPYGIAFYPPGRNPKWIYVGDTSEILCFPYRNGDLNARGPQQHIATVPGNRNHWTRPVVFSPDGKRMFVGVGSASNVDDPDTHPAEKDRADILAFNPNGSGMRVYAYGIRNGGGGLAIDPATGKLWTSVNERDGLGDNLVPDYITHVQPGGFYGWPWWYIGGHQDPRHQGAHPELRDNVITPDVILQPHNASLGITFYEGTQFPARYHGDLFAAEHGSWNRSIRAGYEVICVALHHGRADGSYEDFLTGFVRPDGNAWGRPVAVAVAPDGSLLVTDDGSNSIWRVVYTGK